MNIEIVTTPGKIEEAVHSLFIRKGITLSTAESCTGGGISASLTRVPGASKYFLGGVIAYSNAMKMHLLNVSEKDLLEHGAVSSQVVIQMAEGVLKQANSDWSLAVSGIAGPEGGSLEKPVGTIWAAIAHANHEPEAWEMHFQGSREMIIEKAVNHCLGRLYTKVNSFLT